MAYTWTDIANQEQAYSIRTKLNGLGTKVQTLDGANTTNTSNISTLQSNVNTLQSNMTTAQSNISTNTTNIATNTTHIGTLSNLSTSIKSNLVGAVNEVFADVITSILVFTNVSINSANAVSDSTYANYPYRIDITLSGCTASYVPDVYPSQAIAYLFNSIAQTDSGICSVWTQNNTFGSIVIPTIKLSKEA